MKRPFATLVAPLLFAAAASAQSVTVVKPAAGETVLKGRDYAISWTKSGAMPGLVRVSLRDAQTLAEVRLIQGNAPNSGSCAWAVPQDLPDGGYRIRVSVLTTTVKDDSDPFTIAAPPGGPVKVAPRSPAPGPIAIRFPALTISGAKVVCNVDAFEVTFAYKNTGSAPLPKASSLAAKPDFRVLIDGREMNRGTLVIPAFEAPPGWEMPSFFAAEVPINPLEKWDPEWTLGRRLVVEINANRVNGMAPDSKSFDLRQLGLGCGYDAFINGASYIWDKDLVTVSVRVDGAFAAGQKFLVWNHAPGGDWFQEEVALVPGRHDYVVTHSLKNNLDWTRDTFDVYFNVQVRAVGSTYPDRRDVHHPNNFLQHFAFRR